MTDQSPDILGRVKQALNAASLADVALRLGETLGAVKSWSARGSVPLAALVKASEVSNCSLDWLILGRELRPAVEPDHLPEGVAAASHAANEQGGMYRSGHAGIDRRRLVRAIDTVHAIASRLGHKLTSDELGDCVGVIYPLLR